MEQNAVFKIDKVVNAPPNGKCEIIVTFDPNSIGTEKITADVTSKVLGEYK